MLFGEFQKIHPLTGRCVAVRIVFLLQFSMNLKNLKQLWEVRGELLAAKVEQGVIRLAQYPIEHSYTSALTHIFRYTFA